MSESEVTLRRAPRVGVFLVFGALLGALVTLVLTSLFPTDPAVGFVASYAYFSLFGVPAGLLFGALVAIVLDAIASRRARTVTVARDDVSE